MEILLHAPNVTFANQNTGTIQIMLLVVMKIEVLKIWMLKIEKVFLNSNNIPQGSGFLIQHSA